MEGKKLLNLIPYKNEWREQKVGAEGVEFGEGLLFCKTKKRR